MTTPRRPNATDNSPIDRVEQFTFEPIKGFPMLHWRGKRPFTATQYYPAQHKETHGPEVAGWRNKIYWGDNLQVMSHLLREYRGKVQLVYIDPPFDSKADYKRTIKLRGKIIRNDQNTFEEKQYTDIWTNDEYLQFIYERLILLQELLNDKGSIYIHMDAGMGHYVKVVLDEVFGRGCFQNEIIREKANPKNFTKQAFGNIHDVVLFYSKGSGTTWNKPYASRTEEKITGDFPLIDKDGRMYKTAPLHAPGIRNGETGKPWRGISPPSGNHWRYVHATLNRLDEENKIEWSSTGNPRERVYADDSQGVFVQDIWLGMKDTKTDYPTQKPESLLERIIRASSNPGDLVFDCFMGSGTTQAVAMKLGRRFIGADINLGAVQITTKRLITVGSELHQPQGTLDLNVDAPTTRYTGFEVYNVNNYDIFRNPVEAKDLLLQALEVNRLQPGSLFDGEKDGRMVKIMPVNRIATRLDLNELITGFDYRAFARRQAEHPTQPVERITLVCMGHEPGLAAHLQREVTHKLDIEVVDILRDRQDIQFKRDAEAKIIISDGHVSIEKFYPMNLLAKLSLQQENVGDWRELVESVMIDWNYDGAVLQPALLDIPEGDGLVVGRYAIPADAGTIMVKITDLLAESLEQEVDGRL